MMAMLMLKMRGKDAMEADVFQIGQGCLGEVEFVSKILVTQEILQ